MTECSGLYHPSISKEKGASSPDSSDDDSSESESVKVPTLLSELDYSELEELLLELDDPL